MSVKHIRPLATNLNVENERKGCTKSGRYKRYKKHTGTEVMIRIGYTVSIGKKCRQSHYFKCSTSISALTAMHFMLNKCTLIKTLLEHTFIVHEYVASTSYPTSVALYLKICSSSDTTTSSSDSRTCLILWSTVLALYAVYTIYYKYAVHYYILSLNSLNESLLVQDMYNLFSRLN